MAYDGNETWSKDWKLGNAPKFEALLFFYFLNLPWLTQDDNIKIGAVEKDTIQSFDKTYYTLEMTFLEKPAVGKSINDSFKLYIDSESYLLQAYEYTIGYGYMLDLFGLPQNLKVMGPVFRINDGFTTVDGLVYPNRMHTMNKAMTQTFGHHAILNYSTSKKFDQSRLKMPLGAKIDKSSHLRSTEK